MAVNLRFNETQYKPKPEGVKENIGKSVVGLMTAGIMKTAGGLLVHPAGVKLQKLSENLSESDIVQIKDAIPKALKNSGLKDAGVKVFEVGEDNVDELKAMVKEDLKSGLSKFMPKKMAERKINSIASEFLNGENAACDVKRNLLISPKKGVELSFFHEAGHAINHNLSKAGKLLQKSRYLAMLAAPIALIALIKPDKKENEEPKGIIDKTTDFIKDNAGKLTFAAWTPVLIEEGLASLRGNKIAKEMLNPDLAKKVAKSNALGFVTYLAFAAFSAFGVYAGKKAKEDAN